VQLTRQVNVLPPDYQFLSGVNPLLPRQMLFLFFSAQRPRSSKKKTAVSKRKQRSSCFQIELTAAAGRPAGARLHAAQHETLAFLKIDARIHQHAICPFLQENLQAAEFEGHIARLGRFGYVHSQ
jgi:hypothetical protein